MIRKFIFKLKTAALLVQRNSSPYICLVAALLVDATIRKCLCVHCRRSIVAAFDITQNVKMLMEESFLKVLKAHFNTLQTKPFQ